MKLKILSNVLLLSSLAIIYLTMSSSDNGYYGNGTSCGGASCHGSQNVSTNITLLNFPANYISGTTYTVTVKVANATLGNDKAGFNVFTDGGMFGNISGNGTKTNTTKDQITHSSPMTVVSGEATFTFLWTAPAGANPVTFLVAGNSVNANGNADPGDFWNLESKTILGTYPVAVNDVNEQSIRCYPNPANDNVNIDGLNWVENVFAFNSLGQPVHLNFTTNGNLTKVDCSSLAKGNYFLKIVSDKKNVNSSFTKL